MKIESNEPMPQLKIPLRQVSSMTSRLPGAVAADSNTKAGNLTETAAVGNRLVEAMAGSRIFREYQRAFAEATGLPLTLRALKGWQLAHQDDRNQNGFCARMSKENHSCSACLRMQQQVCDGVNGVPCTLRCQFGLNESAVGVKIGKEIIAYLQTGQVFFKAPKPEQINRVLDQINALDLNVDRREAVQLYNETPVVQPGEYQATIRLLQFFADQLGALANLILLQQKDAEPAQITRARQYIEANSQEDLSLAIVAKQAGMSSNYFCRMFRKVTGVHFTRYVSCVRVEKAKNLLPNLNYRVSEVAFEVGFQSLTHFNRLFKIIAGQSPTEYRRRLLTSLSARKT
ncbi:MAG: helix-turn-helix domain-containing protein [Verrucomicrobiota bacterium]|jgi:AraC-like DNA-binding protein